MTKVESADFWSIEILGSMNPAIHHPAWYRLTHVFSEAEAERALTPEREPHASPVSSRIDAETFRIRCTSDSWEISTTDEREASRIRDVAVATFRSLQHTPVTGYVLAFGFHRATGLSDVGAALVAMSGDFGSALRRHMQPDVARLEFTSFSEEHVFDVAVEPSGQGADKVFVGMSCYHTFEKQGPIDLEQPLKRGIDHDYPFAAQLLQIILESLSPHRESRPWR